MPGTCRAVTGAAPTRSCVGVDAAEPVRRRRRGGGHDADAPRCRQRAASRVRARASRSRRARRLGCRAPARAGRSRARATRERIVPTGTPQICRRLRVGAADDLGEHERVALVVGRARRRARASVVAAGRGRPMRAARDRRAGARRGRRGVGGAPRPAPRRRTPGGRSRAARCGRSSRPGTRGGPPGADEGVLRDVVGVVRAHEVASEAPDVGLAARGSRGAARCGRRHVRRGTAASARPLRPTILGNSGRRSRLPEHELNHG